MKKVSKVVFLVLGIIVLSILACYFIFISVTASAKINENNLININRSVSYFYDNGEKMTEVSNDIKVVSIDELNDYTTNAFVAVEDKRFYEHNGIDVKRLLSATINNIKSLSFKEGASTITQQLIKNTHLSSKKTIKRKLTEIRLAKELERKYSKDQILETYLNTIYFGDNCYGITAASEHYFNKSPQNLTLNESVALAAIIKAPSHYSPIIDKNKCFVRKNLVLKLMYEQGYISKKDYELEAAKDIDLHAKDNKNNEYDYLYFSKIKNKSEDNSPYYVKNIDVYTHCNKTLQSILKNEIEKIEGDCFKSAILLDKNNNVKAYYSNCGDINRQLGSTLKPLAVYAPAIDNDLIDSFTHIIDEKININGYSPSNYNEKYCGKITIKEAIAKSSNACAVKILNTLGVEKALNYLRKTELAFNDGDKTLALALGATEKGNTLSNITAAYTTFINNGKYCKINTIKNKKIKNNNSVNIFSDETASIINDILSYTAKNGTAKKLSDLPFQICAKTGTVGNDNGNTDAYTISYTSEYVLGLYIGSKDSLLNNNITGGTLPCTASKNIWMEIYKNKKPKDVEISNNLIKIDIDKISYNDDEIIQLADSNSPERYKETIIIKQKNLPKDRSNRFSHPKLNSYDLSVNNKAINISLCLPEYYRAELFRTNDDNKIKLNLTKSNEYMDKDIEQNTEYTYSAIPYYIDNNGNKFYGDEVIIGKIKTPSALLGENWWIDSD